MPIKWIGLLVATVLVVAVGILISYDEQMLRECDDWDERSGLYR